MTKAKIINISKPKLTPGTQFYPMVAFVNLVKLGLNPGAQYYPKLA